MSYVIRKTRLSDIEDLAEVERSAAQAFKSIAELAWIADENVMSAQEHKPFITSGLSWLAIEAASQSIAGFLIAEAIGRELYIAEVSVGEAHQKKGIGSKLFKTALEDARALDLKAATLTTFTNVPWNAPYYKKLGFVMLGVDERPSYLEQKLQDQEKEGLSIKIRCAMRKTLWDRLNPLRP